MAITIEGKDGIKFTVDTIEELKQLEELSATSEEPSETSEEDSPLLASERVEPLGKDANGEDLYEGDYVTGTEASPYGITSSSAICEVESESDVKVIQTTDDDMKKYEGEYFPYIDLRDFVRLSDNLGEAKAKYDELNGEEEEVSPTEPEDGDLVKVTESFEDEHGDKIARGTICEYEDWGCSTIFIGSVLLGDNADKLRLVCRKEDRKDIDL